VTNQLQKIYRQAASGQWPLVAASERPQRGEAYRVYAKGGSDYPGPFEVETGGPVAPGNDVDDQ